ncbi:outer membrane lipoprotein-sorting protein [Pseudoalteromonas peptidolytica]|uniref:outer membrane lipoprotein-sorting protein n=1 Tax=Pseudoalteromonas peptidolytica TaxID=61150 RepID=UPI00298E0C82|nr:outer membrane lipoprotein-sorting protein [Pseudoalteromonas peptidolytica]MDW7548747.1 outer membrane lipoprotein-sorting protein [Pseudoalteromonas peptidolytica]
MKIKSYLSSVVIGSIFAFGAIASGTVLAASAEEKGFEISKEAKVRDSGWGDSQASMRMLLRNAQGEEDIRDIRIKSFEVKGDGDKSLTVFDQPRDVKGTAFLSFSHALEADEQWLYLPSLKRVKRISSRNKSGPFMGSEFAFEDLSSFELEKYTYNFLKEESCDLGNCFVVEQFPVDKRSGYKRRVVWVDDKEYRISKVNFYDRKDSLLKTLVFSEYNQYQDKFWRAHKQEMTNHQNGKSTVLEMSGISFSTGLTENDFNQNSLKRAR